MADKSVSELIAAQSVTPTDLFVLEQNGTAKKLTGQTLENWLVSFADGHGGIYNIEKVSTSGLVDTYRITLADTTTFDFVVNNGRGINVIEKTGTEGLVDTYTIQFNDSTSSAFTVTNGNKGDKGDNTYTWIKYASQKPTEASHSFGDVADDWIGIYYGTSATAPIDWMQYEWFQIKGEKGDKGEPATLNSYAVEYQVSNSGSVIPSGAWSASVPVVAQGKYLWTRTTQNFNTGSPVVSYSVSRMGIDGTGSVSSVAGVSPDANGDVSLTASDLGALPSTGGDLTGELRMNGQPISGLSVPTANDQAANMSYVNQQMKKAAPRNLLVNSDFTNPVNQRGQTSYELGAWGGSCIDRWLANGSGASVTIASDGLHLANNIYQSVARQGLLSDKTVTFAAKINGAVYCTSGVVRYTNEWGRVCTLDADGIWLEVCMQGDNSLWACIEGVGGNVITVEWAALYEGEYIADTLPEYQPKGYAVEMLNCNGGAMAMDLLWENASPSSDFSAQEIGLDLMSYKQVMIEFVGRESNLSVTKGKNASACDIELTSTASNTTVILIRSRAFSVSSAGLTIGDNIRTMYTITKNTFDALGVDNAVLKPLRIWGIKGVTA